MVGFLTKAFTANRRKAQQYIYFSQHIHDANIATKTDNVIQLHHSLKPRKLIKVNQLTSGG
jgi:hypothetical protein